MELLFLEAFLLFLIKLILELSLFRILFIKKGKEIKLAAFLLLLFLFVDFIFIAGICCVEELAVEAFARTYVI